MEELIKLSSLKICSNCKKEKSRDSFTKDKRTKDGLDYYCRECKKIKRDEFNKKNREKLLEYKKNFYNKNAPELNIKGQEYYKRTREDRKKNKKRYLKSPIGKAVICRYSHKKKGLGFNPINNWFQGSHYHCLGTYKNNIDIGIYIPSELHNSINHNRKTERGMKKINKAALIWLSEQDVI